MTYVKLNGVNLDGSATSEVSQGDVTDGINLSTQSIKVKTIFIVLHDNTGTVYVDIEDPDGNWYQYADSDFAITTTDEAYPILFNSDNRTVRIRFETLAGNTKVSAWSEQRS